jgi:hypothetical protein
VFRENHGTHRTCHPSEVRVTHSEQPAAGCRGLAQLQAPTQLAAAATAAANNCSTTTSRDKSLTAAYTAAAPVTDRSSVRAHAVAAAAASAITRCRFSSHKLQRCPACSMLHKPSGAAIQLLSRPSCGKSSLQDTQHTAQNRSETPATKDVMRLPFVRTSSKDRLAASI